MPKKEPLPNLRIKRQSLPETLAESLRERILNGEFKEGESLIQETIATEYGVSRMPVREAFKELEASGLITTQIHKGSVVKSIPLEQIAELFDLRALLESELLERSLPKMTDAHFAVTQQLLPQLEAAYLDDDIAQWGKLNWRFHESLYAAADRVQTLAIVQGINIQTDRYIRLQLLLTAGKKEAEVDHRELLKLCEQGDTKKAVQFLRKHIQRAGTDLVTLLKQKRDKAPQV
ncbi:MULTISPECIES: GntR family transcriptional regulator [unclassified Pseudomonas]|uniref:GntR family transcriptional regulator n=1 Tax=unclassified Pseudomonas TaxID=196821 RepID=UPI0015A0B016|nr:MULTISPECIES: GntR family transcriptional regulator [unclassified Pseudomonas]NWC77106.1 GntR family transcriptional regulator [Pseudomonas sp. P7759]WAT25969.1 GntR family transcriptional regulator [Pseudomonas sp. GXZC]